MADARIRAFFAIPVPEALRAAIGTVVERLRGLPGGDRVRWVREETLHVTLRFLGDIERERVPALLDRVTEAVTGLSAFEIHLPRAELFPSQRRPSVVAYTLEPEAPLAALARAVGAGVVNAGLPADERPFRGHLTLGRIRERRSSLAVTASDTALSDPLPVTTVVLFQSELGPSRPEGPSGPSGLGAIHTPLGEAALQ